VWVVDSSDDLRLALSRALLDWLLARSEALQKAPLLVLLNKSDLVPRMAAVEAAFREPALAHPNVATHAVSALDGSGLAPALEWLLEGEEAPAPKLRRKRPPRVSTGSQAQQQQQPKNGGGNPHHPGGRGSWALHQSPDPGGGPSPEREQYRPLVRQQHPECQRCSLCTGLLEGGLQQCPGAGSSANPLGGPGLVRVL